MIYPAAAHEWVYSEKYHCWIWIVPAMYEQRPVRPPAKDLMIEYLQAHEYATMKDIAAAIGRHLMSIYKAADYHPELFVRSGRPALISLKSAQEASGATIMLK